ncbi:hypothetical protein [Actinoplanes aureus]|uniref:Uncharacterized protein n=1 Tax=Actinoplanes aureus TaxID=2792083 RepID=A0A931C436_9ACTN|nr:hypothetical protein [Actinoplanes aureus]MBG0560706.1 hypothetical protein [Actinoplanes aureus]
MNVEKRDRLCTFTEQNDILALAQLAQPVHLRAGAALWSLRIALNALHDRSDEEHRAITEERAAAADPLKSPALGRRQALGGHGDPTGDAILALGLARSNRYADLLGEVLDQLDGVAKHLPSVGDFSPVARIEAAVPAMSPAAADATRLLADRIDGRIRRLIRLGHDRQLVPRIACPGCDTTGLVVRTSPPLDRRVIECFTCGNAWPRAEVLRSVDA